MGKGDTPMRCDFLLHPVACFFIHPPPSCDWVAAAVSESEFGPALL